MARFVLLLAMVVGAWFCLQPSLSLSPWTPHNLMRSLGMPYEWILAYEHALPYALHTIVGAMLMLLVSVAGLFGCIAPLRNLAWSLGSVIGLSVAAEGVQHAVGRGFEALDVGFTVAGALAIAGLMRARGN